MAAVRYRLSVSDPHLHLLQVEVRVRASAGPVELVMPSWTPGSYLLREFARNVQDFAAEAAADGAPLPWSKVDKGTWRVDPATEEEVVVRYRVYANELSVRTSHVDATHAYVNGASVFMLVRGREAEPLTVRVDAPAGWRTTTSLRAEGTALFHARDYDELVDAPMEIGTHELVEWEQSGRPHRYAIWGRGGHDAQRLVDDTRRIVAAAESLFGGLPYPGYTFILHLLPEGRGGLEHRDSCSLQADRWAFEGERYEELLALVAHEFFHVWNAKRIRPAPLGPFDYTRENYTRSLWVVEGLTTYYTDRVLLRAGLITPQRYLERVGDSLARFQALPGRRHQTLEESSFDTWIRFYRPDEHTPNAQISYYQKGALVGLLLDLAIREATGGARSLDDLMRLLWERYGSRDAGFPESGPGGVEALAAEVAGAELAPFFDRHLRTTEELELDRYLGAAGLRLGSGAAGRGSAPADAAVVEARLGVRLRERAGRVEVAHVLEGGAGAEAGLGAGDELVALDGFRVGAAAQLAARIRRREAGTPVGITLFRRDELLSVEARLGPPPAPRLRLERLPQPTPEQAAVRAGWLAG